MSALYSHAYQRLADVPPPAQHLVAAAIEAGLITDACDASYSDDGLSILVGVADPGEADDPEPDAVVRLRRLLPDHSIEWTGHGDGDCQDLCVEVPDDEDGC